MTDTFEEFRVEIKDRRRVVATSSTRAGSVEGAVADDPILVDTINVLSRWLLEGRIPDRAGLELLGDCLYAHLLTGEVAAEFERAMARTARGHRLRVVLEFDLRHAAALAKLPWEYLHVPGGSRLPPTFVAAHSDLVLSRHVNIPASHLTDSETITLLFVNAQTGDTTVTDPSGKTRTLVRGLADRSGGLLEVVPLDEPVTKDRFQQAMEAHTPQIVHFLGHGRYREHVGEVLFTDGQGGEHWVDQDTFGDSFDPVPRLTFLQACEGARTEDYQALSGMALALVDKRLPAVVGFSCKVETEEARQFTERFYTCLLEGQPIDVAVQEGRKKLGMYLERRNFSSRAFGSPVVYLQQFDLAEFGSLVVPHPAGPQPPVAASADTVPHVEPCPNPLCTGRVDPDRMRFCPEPACGTEIERCPQCDRAKEKIKRCGHCGYYAGTDAARAAPAPVTASTEPPRRAAAPPAGRPAGGGRIELGA